MPNTASAERRMRSSARRRQHNKSVKSRLKSLEKSYLASVATGRKDDATQQLRAISSALDKAAKTGAIHVATARRKRSRLSVRAARMK